MFQYECLQARGKPVGYCVNSWLVGSCCKLPETYVKPQEFTTSSSLITNTVNITQNHLLETTSEYPKRHSSPSITTISDTTVYKQKTSENTISPETHTSLPTTEYSENINSLTKTLTNDSINLITEQQKISSFITSIPTLSSEIITETNLSIDEQDETKITTQVNYKNKSLTTESSLSNADKVEMSSSDLTTTYLATVSSFFRPLIR